MSGSNLSVKITADVVDLQTKFAIAKAEVSGLSSELNKLSRAAAAGNLSVLPGAMQQLAGDTVAAKMQANALGAALKKATSDLAGIASAAEHSHGSFSAAAREFRAAFDEISSGRTRMLPGTIAIILQRVMGLGPAMLGAVGGVVALSGGLAYLAYRAIEASRALNQMQLGAEFAGNLNLTRDALKQFADELSRAKGISSSDAREIVGAFASMHNMSAAEVHALSAVVSDFAQITGEDATKAKDALVKMFGDKETAANFAKSLGGVAQAQINMAEGADKTGSAQGVFSAKLEILNSALDRARGTLDKQNASVKASAMNFFGYLGLLQSGMSTEQAHTALLQDQNNARARQVQLLQQLSAQIQSQPPSRDETLKTGVSAAEKENPVSRQVDEANSKIKEMSAALKIAEERGEKLGDTNFDILTAGIAKAQENLSNLQFGPVLERMRAQMESVAATWDGTQSGMLAKQIQIGEATLGSVQKNSKEALSIQQEVSRLEVQARQAAGAETLANAREQISQIGTAERQGALQRLEAERQVWQQVVAGDRLTAAQRIEAQRSLNQTMAGIAREGAAESQAIARQDGEANIAIARLKIDAAKSAIDLTASADQATADRKLQTLRTLTAQEFSLNEQALESQLAALKDEPVAYDRVYNQIRELKARLVADLAALDRQAATAADKGAKDQAKQWQTAVGEIENAESGMVSDLLNRRKSLSKSLLAIGSDLITKEIANDLRGITTRLLLNQNAEASQKALEQGGFLYHLIQQNAATGATIQAQGAQTAAVAAGNAARLSSTAAAAVASKGAGAAAGSSTVMAAAAKAAAGAYASVAQIPYVGPFLAPAAAATAFAAVAAYQGLASLDVGTNYVPRNMVAQIHEGEAVVPKKYNPAAGGGSGGGGGIGSGGDTHHHWNIQALDGASVERVISGNLDVFAKYAGKFVSRGGRF